MLDGAPIFTRFARLTVTQWEHAVVDILRLDPAAHPAQGFAQQPTGASEFTNNEKVLAVDLQADLEFEAGAEAVATLATGSADALARIGAGTDAAGFVRTLGRRAFRRPLTAEEEQRYQGVFALGESLYGPGFANGAALVIRAMLQSPLFLYRSELGPSGQPLDAYEVASKLSFGLLGTTPSDDLLDAAASGALDDAAGVEATARAMLGAPAAVAVMRDFHGQLYRLGVLDIPDLMRATPELSAELAEAAYRFFDAVFAGGEGVQAILTSRRAFVGPGLAGLYGITPAPAALEERTLDAPRVGYFMQVPFLFQNGIGDDPDSTRRGGTIFWDVLCQTLLPPSGTVPPPLQEPRPGQTNRQRLEEETANCGACHTQYLGPLGFAFEGYDGLGRARTTDNGSPVMTEGTFVFSAGPRTFADARELMTILASDPLTHACYATKLMTYALGRDLVESDRAEVQALATVGAEQSIKEMIVALVRSPAFRVRAEGTP